MPIEISRGHSFSLPELILVQIVCVFNNSKRIGLGILLSVSKARCDMKRLQIWTLVIVLACLAYGLSGCDGVSSSVAKQGGQDDAMGLWQERYLQLGQETYQGNCAQCHDEGINGAPVTGDRKSWSNRSPLWSAVLIVHAQNGYLGMPAKGGCTELSDRAVEAAGEYMLSITFPELPRD